MSRFGDQIRLLHSDKILTEVVKFMYKNEAQRYSRDQLTRKFLLKRTTLYNHLKAGYLIGILRKDSLAIQKKGRPKVFWDLTPEFRNNIKEMEDDW